MAFNGLAHFVEVLEVNNQLIRVKEFVDPQFEIAEITDRFSKLPGGGKALLFENTGTDFPVLTNAFGSDERMSLAIGIKDFDDATSRIQNLVSSLSKPGDSFFSKLKMLPTLQQAAKWLPTLSKGRGLCQEVVNMNPDLSMLPVLKCWPFDGGRFITLPMVNTKNPNTGIRNVGMYRMQVFSPTQTGMHWHRHKTGAQHFSEYKKLNQKMPIAVALGGDPVYTYAATAPLPENIDEYLLAGFLRNKRVKLVKGITVDIEVPFDADIVIEGYVDPTEELAWEGPFGDHTGFYSLADWYPTFHVTCITHRRGAIYPATLVGIPPMEDVYMAKATERIFLSPIKFAILPEIKDMNLPQEGVAHNIAIVSLEKTYPGQALKAGHALWGAGQMMFNKIAIIVDANVNVHEPKEVLRAITEHYTPSTDTLISRGPLDILDHASSTPALGGKLLVDATVKHPEEKPVEKPHVLDYDNLLPLLKNSEIDITSINTKLIQEGISMAIIGFKKSKAVSARSIAKELVAASGHQLPKFVVFVDPWIPIEDYSVVTWYVSSNIDPERDCFFEEQEGKRINCLFIDGTQKTKEFDSFQRLWPNMVVSSPETIKQIDAKWDRLNLGAFVSSPSLPFMDMNVSEGAVAK